MLLVGKNVILALGLMTQTASLQKGALKKHVMDRPENAAIIAAYNGRGHGTGFFIDIGGMKYMVTAAHVCGSSDLLISAKGLHKVIVSRPELDLCITTAYQGVATLNLSESDATPGEKITMTGFPGDLIYDTQEGTAHEVMLTQFLLPKRYYSNEEECPKYTVNLNEGCGVFITTTLLNILARGGNSGGPVLNEKGEVIAVLVGSGPNNTATAVPVSEVKRLISGQP